MNRPNGTLTFWRKITVIFVGIAAAAAVVLPVLGVLWLVITQPIMNQIADLRSAMSRETHRLSRIATANREMILIIGEMNQYPISDLQREALLFQLVERNRQTVAELHEIPVETDNTKTERSN